MCSRKYDAAPARVKAPFSDRFFRPCCFSCTCAALETPFDARSRMKELSVEQRGATTSAPLLFFPDLRVFFQQTTNLTRKQILLLHVRATITTPDLSHETNPLGHRHCSVKPSPIHPNAEAVTVLVFIFADIEGLTNTRATHPPQTSTQFQDSVTRPSHIFDNFEATVSPAQVASAFAHEGASPAR